MAELSAENKRTVMMWAPDPDKEYKFDQEDLTDFAKDLQSSTEAETARAILEIVERHIKTADEYEDWNGRVPCRSIKQAILAHYGLETEMMGCCGERSRDGHAPGCDAL